MNQIEIDKLNESITYERGKIYWKENCFWTSELWENLKKLGWSGQNNKGLITIYDQDENVVISGLIGMPNTLQELAKIMR